jgi:hypothetical protein
MDIKIVNVVGYNTPSKKVLCINGDPVVVANGSARLESLAGYVMGTVKAEDVYDKKVLGALKAYKEACENGNNNNQSDKI